MNREELLYLLALTKSEGIGDVMAKKLIDYCGSATAVFEENNKALGKIPGVRKSVIGGAFDKFAMHQATNELAFIEKNNIQYCFYNDVNYPTRLKHCPDKPIVLFSQGNINLDNPRIISIVGTRQMTNYGKTFLDELFSELKSYNPIIISGLAYGVDIHAHRLALEHNLGTVGVLAHGFDRIYPPTHRDTAQKMMNQGGLLTEFWSGTNPDRENFVKRNRIVAGMSQATLVIESAEKGGSLITADLANGYHRDVFAVPGRTSDIFSIGCNQLIKTNRAALLTTAKDLAYILNWEKSSVSKTIQRQLFVEMNAIEKSIYQYLLKEGKTALDLISLHCKLPTYKVATALLNLELKGVIRPLPGKIFEAI